MEEAEQDIARLSAEITQIDGSDLMKTTNALELAKQLIEAKKQREFIRSDYEYYDDLPRFTSVATALQAHMVELGEEIERLEAQLSEMEAF